MKKTNNNRIRNTISVISFGIAILSSIITLAQNNNSLPTAIDSTNLRIEAQFQLEKAKTNKDWKGMSSAYKTIMYNSPKKEWTSYADSIIAMAILSNDNAVIGEAYLTKGIIYFNQKNHSKALDNYILADKYLIKTDDQYAIYKAKYALAQTKYYLGFYDEAIALFRQTLIYFEKENDLATLNTYHALGLCYNKIKKYDLCSFYNNKGIILAKESENSDIIPYFIHSEGINKYSIRKYSEAIDDLTKVIPKLQSKKDYANEAVAYFYIGKSYWSSDQKENAVINFKKVDAIYSQYKYIRPDLREAYQILLTTAKTQNDAKLSIYYIDRLFEIDSTLNTNYKYLSKKIHKEYDTQKLIQEKETIERRLKNDNQKSKYIIGGLAIVLLIITVTHLLFRRRIKQKFERALQKSNEKQKDKNKTSETVIDTEINPEIVNTIIKNLEKFEKTNKFLEKDLTLHKLSGHLKTNTKYASKIILKQTGKKSNEYINDLKIDYIVERLKTENKFRKYTNKALADEAGFGSTQNFTKSFKNRLDISPTHFIEELKKQYPL